MRLSFARGSTVTASPPPGLTSYKASLLAVAVLLLTFQAQTVKIFEPEGQFEIEVPAAGEWPREECCLCLPDIVVSMEASEDGLLNSLKVGSRNLGNDENAFRRLNAELLKIIGRPANPLTWDIAVVIDADDALHHEYLIRCISACTGRLDRNSGQVVRYISNIVLAPPRRAEQAAL